MSNATVKGSEVEPGQVIESAHHWYAVTAIGQAPGSDWIRDADVLDAKGQAGRLLVFGDIDYPAKGA